MNTRIQALKLIVSWKTRKRWIFSYSDRPHQTALVIEAKESSRRMMSLASRATSVPAIPIASPTSACLSAGASFVPSPVTATTAPGLLERLHEKELVQGFGPGHHVKIFCGCNLLSGKKRPELFSRHDRPALQDPGLPGDCLRGYRVVPGDHPYPDARHAGSGPRMLRYRPAGDRGCRRSHPRQARSRSRHPR